jgi:hypothetical protein
MVQPGRTAARIPAYWAIVAAVRTILCPEAVESIILFTQALGKKRQSEFGILIGQPIYEE